ncbi:ROK family transcriptional regulator [Oerskovia enterophila]|uniref:ROK family transcriptional regulator n=1 Tax=Oerskovia enterophila TaxID=43678 RepID=UPI0037FACB23
MLLAGDQRLLREINARAVLDVLDAHDTLGRPEIVAATGLSKTTVAHTLRTFVEQGVVEEAGLDHERRGPAATLYRVDPEHGYALAVDIGHVRVRVALIDLVGRIRARAEQPLSAKDPAARASVVEKLAAHCVAAVGHDVGTASVAIRCAVVGLPAIVDLDHAMVRRVPGLEKGGPTLHAALEEGLGCPVLLENDVNLAAIAEQRSGAGKDLRSFVLLRLGIGVGAGIVIDGKLYRGASGGAGEVAFLPQPGRALGAESIGAASLATAARDAGLPADLAPHEVLDLAAGGDERAVAVVDELSGRLAVLIASISLLLEPQKIFLAGVASEDAVLRRVQAYLADRVGILPIVVEPSRVAADAVLLGAAALARDTLRDQAFSAAVRRAAESGDVPDDAAHPDSDLTSQEPDDARTF